MDPQLTKLSTWCLQLMFQETEFIYIVLANLVSLSHQVPPNANAHLPFHKGWLQALHSIQGLMQQNLKSLCIQGHVEYLLCQIRGYNGFNDHPCEWLWKCSALSGMQVFHIWTYSVWTPFCCKLSTLILGRDTKKQIKCATRTAPAPRWSGQNGAAYSWWTCCCWYTLHTAQVEEELSTYVAGATVSKLMGQNASSDCVNLLTNETAPSHVFINYKNFKDCSLVNTSMPFQDLTCSIENFFGSTTADVLMPNTLRATFFRHSWNHVISVYLISSVLLMLNILSLNFIPCLVIFTDLWWYSTLPSCEAMQPEDPEIAKMELNSTNARSKFFTLDLYGKCLLCYTQMVL